MHYYCEGGCGSTSEEPTTCSVSDCSMNGDEMMECECTDGMHAQSEGAELQMDQAMGTDDDMGLIDDEDEEGGKLMDDEDDDLEGEDDDAGIIDDDDELDMDDDEDELEGMTVLDPDAMDEEKDVDDEDED